MYQSYLRKTKNNVQYFHPRQSYTVEGVMGFPAQTGQLLNCTYTKLSLTETTKTFPASLSLAELMYPGIWFSEQAGEYAAGTPMHRCAIS